MTPQGELLLTGDERAEWAEQSLLAAQRRIAELEARLRADAG